MLRQLGTRKRFYWSEHSSRRFLHFIFRGQLTGNFGRGSLARRRALRLTVADLRVYLIYPALEAIALAIARRLPLAPFLAAFTASVLLCFSRGALGAIQANSPLLCAVRLRTVNKKEPATAAREPPIHPHLRPSRHLQLALLANNVALRHGGHYWLKVSHVFHRIALAAR